MKRIIFFVLILAFFTGCAGQKETVEIDPEALAGDMLASGAFSEQLEFLEQELLLRLYSAYGLDEADIVSAIAYLSTGATAEEFTVFEAADEDAAARITAAFEARVAAQITTCASYNPREVEKLNEAELLKAGSYVILCVADDSGLAKETLKQHTTG